MTLQSIILQIISNTHYALTHIICSFIFLHGVLSTPCRIIAITQRQLFGVRKARLVVSGKFVLNGFFINDTFI